MNCNSKIILKNITNNILELKKKLFYHECGTIDLLRTNSIESFDDLSVHNLNIESNNIQYLRNQIRSFFLI